MSSQPTTTAKERRSSSHKRPARNPEDMSLAELKQEKLALAEKVSMIKKQLQEVKDRMKPNEELVKAMLSTEENNKPNRVIYDKVCAEMNSYFVAAWNDMTNIGDEAAAAVEAWNKDQKHKEYKIKLPREKKD